MGGDDSVYNHALVPRDEVRAAAIPIIGATPAQRRILKSILSGMGTTRITRIEVSKAGGRWPHGQLVSFDATRRTDVRAEWEQGLVAGVFRDRSVEEGLPKLSVFGSRQMQGASAMARARPDPSFKPFQSDDAAHVVAGVEKAADRSNASVDRIALLQPAGLAVAIRLHVDDPARFLSERWLTLLGVLNEDTARYEGRFLEVTDARGKPFVQDFGASRLHWGGSRHDRRYSGCAQFGLTGGRIGYDPPPCPVES